VITVNYQRPEIRVSAAIHSIQSSETKGDFEVVDNLQNQTRATTAAYESDE
jgi:hypothetical protein